MQGDFTRARARPQARPGLPAGPAAAGPPAARQRRRLDGRRAARRGRARARAGLPRRQPRPRLPGHPGPAAHAVRAKPGDGLRVDGPRRVARLPLPLAERYPSLRSAADGRGHGSRCRAFAARPRPAPGGARALGARRRADDDHGERVAVNLAPARRTARTRFVRHRQLDARPDRDRARRRRGGLALPAREARSAGDQPAFWIAPGSYQIDGLFVEARGGGEFPSVASPRGGLPVGRSPAADGPLGGCSRAGRGRPAGRLPGGVGAAHHGGRGSRHPRAGARPRPTRARVPSCSAR